MPVTSAERNKEMTLTRLGNRAVLTAASLALCALSLALPTPAIADSNSVSLTLGPIPQVPISACVDTTCVSTPALTSATLTATATITGDSLPLALLTSASCPTSTLGIAVRVSSLKPVTVTVSGSVSGTTTNGPVTIPVGPITETIVPGTPGVLVSACTT